MEISLELTPSPAPVLFISHGGGPLPLLGDRGHQTMVDFLHEMHQTLTKPAAILVISAHWEADKPTLTSHASPALIYDYYGFPQEAYQIEYPARGNPVLAEKIFHLLKTQGIEAQLDEQRGFDHGLFVPLKILYPQADIPCVQLSLANNLDPEFHIQMGKALSALRQDNLLIIGSGFSFHNLRELIRGDATVTDIKNQAFEQWLIDTCTNIDISESERSKRLIEWEKAPHARYCHPREEHLLPLHVCYGIANSAAKLVFNDKILNKQTSAYLW